MVKWRHTQACKIQSGGPHCMHVSGTARGRAKNRSQMIMMRKHQIEIMHTRAFRQLLPLEHCDGILTFKCIRRYVVHTYKMDDNDAIRQIDGVEKPCSM